MNEVPSVVRQADGSFLAMRARRSRTWSRSWAPSSTFVDVTDEVDTLAGYMMTRVGRLPSRGEVVPGPGDFEIEVLERRSAPALRSAPSPATRAVLPRRERSAGPREASRYAAKRRPPHLPLPDVRARQRPTVNEASARIARLSHRIVARVGLAGGPLIAFAAGALSALALAAA